MNRGLSSGTCILQQLKRLKCSPRYLTWFWFSLTLVLLWFCFNFSLSYIFAFSDPSELRRRSIITHNWNLVRKIPFGKRCSENLNGGEVFEEYYAFYFSLLVGLCHNRQNLFFFLPGFVWLFKKLEPSSNMKQEHVGYTKFVHRRFEK